MATKKEMKEQYKQMKPEMGIFGIKSKTEKKCLLSAVADLKSRMNRFQFQLDMGSHPNRELQKDWKTHGQGDFIFEILEQLEYDKDETRTDYSEDLEILRMDWEGRITNEGWELY